MSAATSADFAPLSVLIVDDEAPARDRLRDLLGDIADTQPTRIAGLAASGVEALAVLERELPKLKAQGIEWIDIRQMIGVRSNKAMAGHGKDGVYR